ncbi:hypothetical protein B0H19DRAFT_1377743 [Mycena capillaripes]|nr:hypothetical protein B0H19DRAFT_1377743 [Mycena capillaripes]
MHLNYFRRPASLIMAAYRNGYFDCWKLEWWYGLGIMGMILVFGGAYGAAAVLCILGIKSHLQRNSIIDRELLSRITTDTPISGFYGPGSWWAWLITIGMTHVHTISAVRRTGKVPPGWDYDLIGASAYMLAAAIDLILKSRTITQLGTIASEASLLPALVCAERVVLLGTCSSFFSIAMTLIVGDSWHIRMRTAGIAGLPVLIALVASGFTWHAHQAISQTAPVPWCNFHNNGTGGLLFFSVDSPVELGKMALEYSSLLMSPLYWIMTVPWACTSAAILIYGEPSQRRSVRSVVQPLAILGTIALLFPPLLIVFMDLLFLIMGSTLYLLICLPVYIVGFFPQGGYFPPTGMSVLDMDQAAALLAIVVVAAIRSWRPIFRALRSRFWQSTAAASYELSPLLPVSADGTTGD